MRVAVFFAFVVVSTAACSDSDLRQPGTPTVAAPASPVGYVTPYAPPATITPTVDLTEKAYVAAEFTQSANWGATQTAAEATLQAGLADAQATEAVLPTPLMLVSRGSNQESGDVVAIGVPRAGSAGSPLPDPVVISDTAADGALSDQYDANPLAGVATWVSGGPSAGSAQALWIYRPPDAPRRLVQPAPHTNLFGPRVSPDGRWIAYVRSDFAGSAAEIRAASVDGTADRQIAVYDRGQGCRLVPLGWTGDGTKVLLILESDSCGSGLHEVELATGAIRRINTPDQIVRNSALDPTGTRVAYGTDRWTSDDPSAPGPPYQLKVLDLATGTAVTVMENDTNPYGAVTWSPEGGRLMVSLLGLDDPLDSVLAVHVATGEAFPFLSWFAHDLEMKIQTFLVPVAWLPGEVAVLADGGIGLYVADLDATQQDGQSEHAGGALWRLNPPGSVAAAPAGRRLESDMAFLGYLSPGTDPAGALLVPEQPGTRSAGPNGWYARLLTTGPASPLWRSVLQVVGPEGQNWTAMDEYVPAAVCGSDMEVFGWSADGSLLFGRPYCGEGCSRGGGPEGGYRLSLETGAIEPLEGSGYALSPDGEWLAAHNGYDVGEVGWNILFRNLVTGSRVESTVPLTGGDVDQGQGGWTSLIWSPDSRHVALADLVGSCPEEHASTVFVVRALDGEVVLHQSTTEGTCCPPGKSAAYPVAWEGPNHVRLGWYSGVLREGALIEVP